MEKKKLYIGNLSFEVTESDLSTLFSEIGTVDSVNLITDRYTGRSKGFAFVEMSSDEEAKKVREKFNGHSLKGREIVIDEARPPRESKGFGGKKRFNRF